MLYLDLEAAGFGKIFFKLSNMLLVCLIVARKCYQFFFFKSHVQQHSSFLTGANVIDH